MTERKLESSVSLCDIRTNPKSLFSGTLYSAQGRLFVITCAHAVPTQANNKIWLIRAEGHALSKGIPQIILTARTSTAHPDIAMLEFEPKILEDYLKGYEPIGPEDIGSLDYSILSHEVVVLTGSTVEKAEYVTIGKGEAIRTHIGFLKHESAKPEEWPDPSSADEPNDPKVDLYLKSIKKSDGVAQDWYYQRPHGLSGGGIWAITIRPDGLTTPADLKLVGVQSAWNTKAGFLRGVRIEALKGFAPSVWS